MFLPRWYVFLPRRMRGTCSFLAGREVRVPSSPDGSYVFLPRRAGATCSFLAGREVRVPSSPHGRYVFLPRRAGATCSFLAVREVRVPSANILCRVAILFDRVDATRPRVGRAPLTSASLFTRRVSPAGDRGGVQTDRAGGGEPRRRRRRAQVHPPLLHPPAEPAAAHLRGAAPAPSQRRDRPQGGDIDEHRRDVADHQRHRVRHRPRLREAEGRSVRRCDVAGGAL